MPSTELPYKRQMQVSTQGITSPTFVNLFLQQSIHITIRTATNSRRSSEVQPGTATRFQKETSEVSGHNLVEVQQNYSRLRRSNLYPRPISSIMPPYGRSIPHLPYRISHYIFMKSTRARTKSNHSTSHKPASSPRNALRKKVRSPSHHS